jgi:hypothetical protein
MSFLRLKQRASVPATEGQGLGRQTKSFKSDWKLRNPKANRYRNHRVSIDRKRCDIEVFNHETIQLNHAGPLTTLESAGRRQVNASFVWS